MGKIKEIYIETLMETENLNNEELISLLGDKNIKLKVLKNVLLELIENPTEKLKNEIIELLKY